jgi:hypothetical protein
MHGVDLTSWLIGRDIDQGRRAEHPAFPGPESRTTQRFLPDARSTAVSRRSVPVT